VTLILHEIGDAAALWAADRLRVQGCEVDTVSSADLGAATHWDHRIDDRSASIVINLADGRILSSSKPEPMLNRLSFVPFEAMRNTAGADLGYAIQEAFAFYLSWLYAWPAPVINRPTPQGLCGNYRHPSVWATLGARVGLNIRHWRQTDADSPQMAWAPTCGEATVYVVGNNTILPAALPTGLGAPCAKLAALAETTLLGIDFARGVSGEWEMVAASPLPRLEEGGEPLIGALAAALS
jgi:hypothetical protein